MKNFLQRLAPLLGILVAILASTVAVRSWLGERALAAGRAAQDRGDLQGAEAAYRLARGRGNADGTLALARLGFLRRRWDDAEALVAEAMALAPARGYPHVLRSSILLARPGAWDRPREERILEGCRTASLLEHTAGALRGECGDLLLSLVALRQAAWEPERRAALREEARDAYAAAIALGRTQEGFAAPLPRERRAAPRLLAAAAARGADDDLLVQIAVAAGGPDPLVAAVGLIAARGGWEAAAPAYWALAERAGEMRLFSLAATEALARGKLPEAALGAARRGMAADPGGAELPFRAAEIASRLAGPPGLEAASLFALAVERDPASARYRKRYAQFLLARALPEEAAAEARAAVDREPKDAEMWFLLGEAARRAGRAGEAREAYARAAALKPGNAAYRKAAGG